MNLFELALSASRPSWMGVNGLRGVQRRGYPTVQGDGVSGWRDKYVVTRRSAIATVENPRVSQNAAICPSTDRQIQLVVSGIMACPGYVGPIPNGTYVLTFNVDIGWILNDGTFIFVFQCVNPDGVELISISDLAPEGPDPSSFFSKGPDSGPGPTFTNAFTLGTCGGGPGTQQGYDGTVTWSVI